MHDRERLPPSYWANLNREPLTDGFKPAKSHPLDMFVFKPILGSASESPAVQSLLEFDQDVRILVGVGWDLSFDAEKLQELEKFVQQSQKLLCL